LDRGRRRRQRDTQTFASERVPLVGEVVRWIRGELKSEGLGSSRMGLEHVLQIAEAIQRSDSKVREVDELGAVQSFIDQDQWKDMADIDGQDNFENHKRHVVKGQGRRGRLRRRCKDLAE
jgi:hypothetical protein